MLSSTTQARSQLFQHHLNTAHFITNTCTNNTITQSNNYETGSQRSIKSCRYTSRASVNIHISHKNCKLSSRLLADFHTQQCLEFTKNGDIHIQHQESGGSSGGCWERSEENVLCRQEDYVALRQLATLYFTLLSQKTSRSKQHMKLGGRWVTLEHHNRLEKILKSVMTCQYFLKQWMWCHFKF